MKSKAQALNDAKRRQQRLNTAEAEALDAATRRDAAVFAAQQAGASYADIQEATGLSTARITQVLRRTRDARTATIQEN